MRRSSAPTLQDIANEAGVSSMMASVVLNGARSSTRVSELSRARIIVAAKKLGYRRNAAAVGLARSRMNTLGVVAVIDSGDINLYVHEVLSGILESANQYNQNITLFSIKDWRKEEHRILDWCDGRIDGMILVGPILSPEFAQLLPTHTPFITLHSNIPLPNTRNMEIENEVAAYKMTRYLLDCGHRRILHISGGHFTGAAARVNGFRRAVEEHGLTWDDSMVFPGKFSLETGRLIMNELVSMLPELPLPEAIFCANDSIACGCMEVLNTNGISVPKDISIAGFDDTLIARMTHPPLTTMRQPFRLMGRRTVEHLLEMQTTNSAANDPIRAPFQESAAPLQEESSLQSHIEHFEVKLIVRDTVAILSERQNINE